jgi:hypothetical protein
MCHQDYYVNYNLNNFKNVQDAHSHHMESRTKCQFVVVTLGEATASLTLATYNTVQIVKIGTKIAAQDEKMDLSADIT